MGSSSLLGELSEALPVGGRHEVGLLHELQEGATRAVLDDLSAPGGGQRRVVGTGQGDGQGGGCKQVFCGSTVRILSPKCMVFHCI